MMLPWLDTDIPKTNTSFSTPTTFGLSSQSHDSNERVYAFRPSIPPTPEEASEMLLEKLEQAGRVPSKDKFRRMACNTFIFTGACPYNDRCVFLHDYRIKAENVKVRTTRQTRSNTAVKDTFYWPDMTRKDVIRNTDSQGLPSANQMYMIPEAFKTNPSNFHNRGLYSLWMHFVEFCVHNSVFYTKRYRDITSEPFFTTSAYVENVHVVGAKRLRVFVQLSLGYGVISGKNKDKEGGDVLAMNSGISASRGHMPVDLQQNLSMPSLSRHFSMPQLGLDNRGSGLRGPLHSVPLMGLRGDDGGFDSSMWGRCDERGSGLSGQGSGNRGGMGMEGLEMLRSVSDDSDIVSAVYPYTPLHTPHTVSEAFGGSLAEASSSDTFLQTQCGEFPDSRARLTGEIETVHGEFSREKNRGRRERQGNNGGDIFDLSNLIGYGDAAASPPSTTSSSSSISHHSTDEETFNVNFDNGEFNFNLPAPTDSTRVNRWRSDSGDSGEEHAEDTSKLKDWSGGQEKSTTLGDDVTGFGGQGVEEEGPIFGSFHMSKKNEDLKGQGSEGALGKKDKGDSVDIGPGFFSSSLNAQPQSTSFSLSNSLAAPFVPAAQRNAAAHLSASTTANNFNNSLNCSSVSAGLMPTAPTLGGGKSRGEGNYVQAHLQTRNQRSFQPQSQAMYDVYVPEGIAGSYNYEGYANHDDGAYGQLQGARMYGQQGASNGSHAQVPPYVFQQNFTSYPYDYPQYDAAGGMGHVMGSMMGLGMGGMEGMNGMGGMSEGYYSANFQPQANLNQYQGAGRGAYGYGGGLGGGGGGWSTHQQFQQQGGRQGGFNRY
eukprot:gene27840-33621_t